MSADRSDPVATIARLQQQIRRLECAPEPATGDDPSGSEHADHAMWQREDRYRGFLDSLSSGVVAHGPDARVLYCNRRALELLGLTADELTGAAAEAPAFRFLNDDESVMPVDDYPIVRTLRTQQNLSGYLVGIVHPRRGDVTWVVCNSHRMLDEDGELEYVLISFLDITELREAGEERRRLEAQILHAQKLESLGILAGGIAHDFNNLLMVILGHAELALSDLPPESPTRKSLEDITDAARRASGLSQQMLDYSGRGKFTVAPVDLNKLVAEMLGFLTTTIPKKIELTTRLAPTLPPVLGDSNQIQQIVMNLITNASEAIGEDKIGRITLTTGVRTCTEEDLRASYLDGDAVPGDHVLLEVHDSGVGMDEQTMASVFDPFFTTKFTGRGLGLAVVLGIVRGHHGAIMVDSQPGSGTTFTILLPVPEEPKAADESAPPESSPARGWRGQGLVLVVDDEPAVLDVAGQMVARWGFDVVKAVDGRDAVEKYRQHAGSIVGVLLDLTMPGMDGCEACDEIRRQDPAARIILSSGYEDSNVADRVARCRPDAFIKKPYASEDLARTLRGLLERD